MNKKAYRIQWAIIFLMMGGATLCMCGPFFGQAWTFALPFTGLGGFIFLRGIRNIIWAYKSKHWPTVKGSVMSSRVKKNRSPSGNSYTYNAKVKFRYSVNGSNFISTRLYFGHLSGTDKNLATELVANLKHGMSVSVYHHPTRLNEAVLSPGPRIILWQTVGFGLLFSCVGIFMLAITLTDWPGIGPLNGKL